jgi:hypothetical protein
MLSIRVSIVSSIRCGFEGIPLPEFGQGLVCVTQRRRISQSG